MTRIPINPNTLTLIVCLPAQLDQQGSLFTLDGLLLGHALEATHAAHHLGHVGVRGHLLHHVHDVAGAPHLGHHLGVDHGLQFAHDLVGVAHHAVLVVHVLAQVGLPHLGDESLQLLVLLQQHLHLLHPRPRPLRDPPEPALVGDGRVPVQLVGGHRVHDVDEPFDPLDRLLLVVLVDQVGARPRQQREEGVERPQLEDALELSPQVPNSELPLLHLLEQLLLVLHRHHVLHLLHELLDVSLPEQPLDEGERVEGLEVLEVLPVADEDYGTLGGGHCGEGASSLGMAVHLGDDHGTDVDGLAEGLGLGEALLPDGAVHHEDAVVGVDCLLDLLHLIEELGLLLVAARGVDDDDLHALLLELGDALLGDGDGVGLDVAAVEGHPDLGGVLLELVEGAGAEGVSADHGDAPALLLVVVGDLAAGGGLATALEADEHDDVDLASLGLEGLLVDFEQGSQFLDHCRFDQDPHVAPLVLLPLELGHDVLPHLHHVPHVDVAAQQGVADLLYALLHCLLVHHRRLVELLQRRGYLPPQLRQNHYHYIHTPPSHPLRAGTANYPLPTKGHLVRPIRPNKVQPITPAAPVPPVPAPAAPRRAPLSSVPSGPAVA